jgi:virginiamycin B lyase
MKRRQEALLTLVSILFGAGLSAQTLTEFALPEDARPGSIVAGPDGNLWFTDAGPDTQHWFFEPNLSRIGRITTSGEITFFPGKARPFHIPTDLTVGPDGNVWVVHQEFVGGDGAINRVTASGQVTELLWSGAYRITTGPDGNLWFTDLFRDIGRMTPAGQVTYFSTPQSPSPMDISIGSDGNVWFTYFQLTRVGRITPAGVVTELEVPAFLNRVTSGPDGNLWFTGEGNRIVRMTTAGAVTESTIPGSAMDLIAAPDGNIWFAYADNRIGRITTDGRLLEDIRIPGPASGLTGGPDGNVWFTLTQPGRIGRISFAHEPAIDSRILPVVGSTAGTGGSYFRTAMQLHNPTSAPMSGRVVFHRSGESGTDSDPAVSYSLNPGQTRSIADLLPSLGLSGLGSADIEVTSGQVPTVTVRVFNDAGEQGTTGFTEEPMREEDALRPEVSGVLLVPADPTRFRFNLGVRTLETEATATLTVRDAAGALLKTVSRTFPTTYHEQRSAGEFLGVSTLPAGGSIGISMSSGSAIFYGATVDNTTGDPSFQVARPAPLR